MCQFPQVVRLDAERYMTYCEHGSVSLTWFGCTFHMHVAELAFVAELFAAGQGVHEHFILDRCADKWGHVKWAFWSRNACLLLSPSEAKALLALLRRTQDAVANLQTQRVGIAPSCRGDAKTAENARLLN